MRTLEELVAGGAEEQRPASGPPNPRKRTCHSCQQLDPANAIHDFNDDWTCSNCGNRSVHFTEFSDCADCGERRREHRYKNKITGVNCACGLSDEERQKRIDHEVAVERARAEERRKELEIEEMRQEARTCWVDFDRDCTLPHESLHPHCKFCTRFRTQPVHRRARRKPTLETIPMGNSA